MAEHKPHLPVKQSKEYRMARYSTLKHVALSAITWDPASPAEWVNDHIVLAHATSNAYLITGDEGDVVINTGVVNQGARIREKFEELIGRKLKVAKIVFTQSHPDHTGGWEVFADPGVELYGQRNFGQICAERRLLGGFFYPRQHRVLSAMMPPGAPANIWSATPDPAPLTTFADEMEFTCSSRTYRLITLSSGETLDSLAVWLPEEKTVFTGNWAGAIHRALPNFYTARGDRDRSIPAWLADCDKLLALHPELLITGHEQPIAGYAQIAADLGKVRAAVQFIHDQTVAGMVAGTDLPTIQQTLELPAELEPRNGRCEPHWIARSVWEEYTGWFRHERTSELYAMPQSAVWPELVDMAGGADKVADKARAHLPGEPVKALHLIEMAVGVAPQSRVVREVELAVYEALLEGTGGRAFDLIGWLEGRIAAAEAALAEAG